MIQVARAAPAAGPEATDPHASQDVV